MPTESILDEADREHFPKSPEERKNFISAALKLEDNEILDTQEKRDQVMNLMLKQLWRMAMKVIRLQMTMKTLWNH